MEYTLIVVAAGKGTRLNLGYNKAFYKIKGKTILEWSLANFYDAKKIIVVAAKDEIGEVKALLPNVTVVEGGTTREESVFNGLRLVNTECVMIHDADRPNVDRNTINNVIVALNAKSSSVVPYINKNAAKSLNGRIVSDKVIQTPQGFIAKSLLEAFSLAYNENRLDKFKDDASILEGYKKVKTCYVEGNANNIKLTTKEDLEILLEVM